MKYFSINSVSKAYSLVSLETKDKFWGILAILYSIDHMVEPNLSYNINAIKLSSFLENTFRLKDKKTYENSNSVYSAVFSSVWVEKTLQNFLVGNPNILPIIVWAYRRHGFTHAFSIQELIAQFVSDFHISKEIAEDLFSLERSSLDIIYVDTLYDDIDLLKLIEGDGYDLNKTTLKMQKEVAVANAGDLSRGPFFQPLYASLNTLECLTIYPFNVSEYYSFTKSQTLTKDLEEYLIKNPLQLIYYGAPGTGKSHSIDGVVSEDNSVRTTFHPDSDYASFVGAYKPTMASVAMSAFVGKEVHKAQPQGGHPGTEQKIVYKYVPQAFLKAYVQAWMRYNPEQDEPYYLVIEEINRGNCAQIFCDLFQLLDRNNMGASSYPITADEDIEQFLATDEKGFAKLKEEQKEVIRNFVLVKDNGKTEYIGESILNGSKLLLPPNLRIWASMNTSDQSLFPIDSAFKRRWNWKYMPIEYKPVDHNGNIISWTFKIGESQYSWGAFLEKINPEIYSLTESSDKQMGYFFAKADPQTGIISEDIFLNKVLFYLWTDVFKDYDVSSAVFKNKKENRSFRFTDFFEDPEALENFIENLGLKPLDGDIEPEEKDVSVEEDEEEEDETNVSAEEVATNGYTVEGESCSRTGTLKLIVSAAISKAQEGGKSMTVDNLMQTAKNTFRTRKGKEMDKTFFIRATDWEEHERNSKDTRISSRYDFIPKDTEGVGFYVYKDYGEDAETNIFNFAKALGVNTTGLKH